MNKTILSYENTYLVPRFSNLGSRSEASTMVKLGKHFFNLPVVPANMKDVISEENALYMARNGFFYIYHRFGDTMHFLELADMEEEAVLTSISVGIKERDYKLLKDMKDKNVYLNYITIDVAHAHQEGVKKMVAYIQEDFPVADLIVGNIATAEAAEFLYGLGVNIFKVGIGGGSICTTKYKTGFHLPTLESVRRVSSYLNGVSRETFIIADGGAKHYGDIAKALVIGADMVMSGGWFASCVDSPAKMINGNKIYRGSTSVEIKGENKHVEGRVLELDGVGVTYEERLDEIGQAVRSSISYAGGSDLSAFAGIECVVL